MKTPIRATLVGFLLGTLLLAGLAAGFNQSWMPNGYWSTVLRTTDAAGARTALGAAGSGSAAWGSISGSLAAQSDLSNATNWAKLSTNVLITSTGTPADGQLAGYDGTGGKAIKPLTSASIGNLTVEGPVILSSTNTWTAANAGTNFVVDFAGPQIFWDMTTNVNLIHSTNGVSNVVAFSEYAKSIHINNNSGTNFAISWPATWKPVGGWTSPVTLTNGDYCDVAIRWAGANTSQTNNTIAVGYKGTSLADSTANWTANGTTGSVLAGTASPAELYTGSFKLYRGALTPVDAGTQLDFGSTNRYWSCTLTGNVTFTTANLAAGKHANLMITAPAAPATITWPTNWIFIGYKPSYITANKHADLYLKSTSTADSGVWAFYGEEQ